MPVPTTTMLNADCIVNLSVANMTPTTNTTMGMDACMQAPNRQHIIISVSWRAVDGTFVRETLHHGLWVHASSRAARQRAVGGQFLCMLRRRPSLPAAGAAPMRTLSIWMNDTLRYR